MDEGEHCGVLPEIRTTVFLPPSFPLLAQVQPEIHKAAAAAAAETLSVGRNLAPSLFPVPSHPAAAVLPLHFCGVALWRRLAFYLARSLGISTLRSVVPAVASSLVPLTFTSPICHIGASRIVEQKKLSRLVPVDQSMSRSLM